MRWFHGIWAMSIELTAIEIFGLGEKEHAYSDAPAGGNSNDWE